MLIPHFSLHFATFSEFVSAESLIPAIPLTSRGTGVPCGRAARTACHVCILTTQAIVETLMCTSLHVAVVAWHKDVNAPLPS